jgi:hypothetical protein
LFAWEKEDGEARLAQAQRALSLTLAFSTDVEFEEIPPGAEDPARKEEGPSKAKAAKLKKSRQRKRAAERKAVGSFGRLNASTPVFRKKAAQPKKAPTVVRPDEARERELAALELNLAKLEKDFEVEHVRLVNGESRVASLLGAPTAVRPDEARERKLAALELKLAKLEKDFEVEHVRLVDGESRVASLFGVLAETSMPPTKVKSEDPFSQMTKRRGAASLGPRCSGRLRRAGRARAWRARKKGWELKREEERARQDEQEQEERRRWLQAIELEDKREKARWVHARQSIARQDEGVAGGARAEGGGSAGGAVGPGGGGVGVAGGARAEGGGSAGGAVGPGGGGVGVAGGASIIT